MTAPVYVAPDVAAVHQLYRDLVDQSALTRSPADQLGAQAGRLADGHRLRCRGAAVELGNWHPRLAARPDHEVWAADLRADDFLLTLANEHGYRSWAAVVADPTPHPSGPFEAAVDAVVDGDLAALEPMLRADPALATARSHWAHRATLLHYLAANGVETYRQRVSPRAAEVAGWLLSHGADIAATADMYGGGQTTMDLLLTSSHPHDAGVTAAVAQVSRG